MGKTLPLISEREAAFISKQPVFFVATAAAEGRVNVSPRAPGTSVAVLDEHSVAMLDLTGSGSETAAHLMEHGRITLLFVNLEDGPPKMLRLHGHGQRVLLPHEAEEVGVLAHFPKELATNIGFRAVYTIAVERISTSCGYSMPIMRVERQRTTLDECMAHKPSMTAYRSLKNSYSIDGLPSVGMIDPAAELVAPIAPGQKDFEPGYIFARPAASRSEQVAAASILERLQSCAARSLGGASPITPSASKVSEASKASDASVRAWTGPFMTHAATFVLGVVLASCAAAQCAESVVRSV